MGTWLPRNIKKKDLWKATNKQEIGKEVRYRIWKWIGRVMWREDGNIAKAALFLKEQPEE